MNHQKWILLDLDIVEKSCIKNSELFQVYLQKLLGGVSVEKGQVLIKEVFGEKTKITVLDFSDSDKKMKINGSVEILFKGN